ncbi:hypothetical protein [Phormidesmis priestleyi]|uniref:hypothetical protein n=1 Tax=Phormidesmis priestleyi TaxID=268141 RepID=UPI0012E78715|nr:hypothetical protein [Phormidesmis priestleyi]
MPPPITEGGITFALTGRRQPLQLNRLYWGVPVQRGCSAASRSISCHFITDN